MAEEIRGQEYGWMCAASMELYLGCFVLNTGNSLLGMEN